MKDQDSFALLDALVFTFVLAVVLFFSTPADADVELLYVPGVYHYDRSHDYEESNNVIALKVDRFLIGQFTNSFGDPSMLAGYVHPIKRFEGFHWSVYVATGYEDAALMPLAGVGYSWDYFFVEVTPVLLLGGFKIPLGGK